MGVQEDLLILSSASTRMSSTAGEAHTTNAPAGVCEIRFSVPIMSAMPESERVDTIYHEVAHCAADFVSPGEASHGETWRYFMGLVGIDNPRPNYDPKCLDRKILAGMGDSWLPGAV